MHPPKVFLIHENEDWTAPLEAQLRALGTPFESWHLATGNIELDAVPPEGVYFSRMSASAHTRDHRFAPEFTSAVLRWLEQHERTVLNGSRVLELEISKVAQQTALAAAGIRTPRTIVACGTVQVLAAAGEFEGSFIVKHNRGGKGLGVHKFDSVQALATHLSSADYAAPIDGLTLVQAYIRAPQPFITRCEFVGGEFLYALRVNTSDGFELCPADVCTPRSAVCEVDSSGTNIASEKFAVVDNFSSPLIEQYRHFLRRCDVSVAGIEFIMDEHGTAYTYDVNTNTNYNVAAEAKTGSSGMVAIAQLLSHTLAEQYPALRIAS